MMKGCRNVEGGGFLKIVSYEGAYRDQVIALVLSIQNDEAGVGLTFDDQPDLLEIDVHYRVNGGGFWLALVR